MFPLHNGVSDTEVSGTPSYKTRNLVQMSLTAPVFMPISLSPCEQKWCYIDSVLLFNFPLPPQRSEIKPLSNNPLISLQEEQSQPRKIYSLYSKRAGPPENLLNTQRTLTLSPVLIGLTSLPGQEQWFCETKVCLWVPLGSYRLPASWLFLAVFFKTTEGQN